MKLASPLKCPLCGRPVYANESIKLGDKMLIHNSCFKCQKEGCCTKLSLLSFTGVGNKFYCRKHAAEETNGLLALARQPPVQNVKVVSTQFQATKVTTTREALEQQGLGLGKKVTLSILQDNKEVSAVDGRIRHLPITNEQFVKICEKYPKTYLSLDEARHFLKELAIFSHLEYDEVDGDALLEQCDENNDGWITLKEFQHLFFASTRHLQINLSKSLRILQKKTLLEHGHQVSEMQLTPPAPTTTPTKGLLPKVLGTGTTSPTPISPSTTKVSVLPTVVSRPAPTGGPPPPGPSGMPPPPPGPGQLPARPGPKKKWVIAADEDRSEWQFNGKIAEYMPIDDGIDWHSCKGFYRSALGSGGVFFLGWEGEKVAVLKGSSTVLADKTATEIGLWVNLPMPHLHIIKFGIGSEFLEVVKCLDKLDQLKPENQRGRHRAMVEIPILTVMEFVPGTDFTEIDAHETLTTKNCDAAEVHKRLFDIGRIIMYDVLLNNWDRLPILWQSEGNLGNLFYAKDPKQRIVAIDNTITSIPVGTDPYNTYAANVRQLLEDIASFDGTEGAKPLVEKTRTYFKEHLGVDVGHEGTKSVWQGLLVGTVAIVENVTKAKLERLRGEMAHEVHQVFEAMVHGQDKQGQYGLVRVKIDFIDSIRSIFEEFVPRMKPLIKF